ncbi:MAG TPA: helix-turn-helix domain-containing protein [Candidatus Limnocylindrales bacterium]
MEEDWLSTAAAATLARVHQRTVERWVTEGRLRAKVEWRGNRAVYWIRRSDLVAYVRAWLREEWR